MGSCNNESCVYYRLLYIQAVKQGWPVDRYYTVTYNPIG